MDEITVLLAEYNTRCTERNLFVKSSIGNLTIGLTLFYFILYLAGSENFSFGWVLVPVIFLIYLSIETIRHFLLLYDAKYIEFLEEIINVKMGNKNILNWELRGAPRNTLGYKIFIQHESKDDRVINYYPLVVYFLFSIMLLFGLYCFYRANLWFNENSNILLFSVFWTKCFYFGSIIMYTLFLIYCISVAQPRILNILEKRLKGSIKF